MHARTPAEHLFRRPVLLSKHTNVRTLHYFYDALCGWCYGFSPVILRIQEQWANRLAVQVYSGGMIQGDRIGPLAEVAPYIRSAYKEVEARTGVQFGVAFIDQLEEGAMVMDSLPPAQSLAVMKRLRPERQLAYASALQKGIYFHGHSPRASSWQIDAAVELGANRVAFAQALHHPDSVQHAEEDFRQSGRFGIQGFPSLVLQTPDEYFLIARGYRPYEELNAVLEEITRKKE